jgi:hypothetical protein
VTFHIDIFALGFSAIFRNAGGVICATTTGDTVKLAGVCQRVQADENILSATYTGTLPAGSYPKFSA